MRCAVDVAPVRAEPDDGAEQVTQALRGEPLRVEERRDGWARVVTAYDYPGWIREEAVEEGDGSLPADAEGTPVDVARGVPGDGVPLGRHDRAGHRLLGPRPYGVSPARPDRPARRRPAGGCRGTEVDELQPGDLITYADPGEPADHIAFWLGDGRILHSTSRDGLGVNEEVEPESLRARRRKLIRL